MWTVCLLKLSFLFPLHMKHTTSFFWICYFMGRSFAREIWEAYFRERGGSSIRSITVFHCLQCSSVTDLTTFYLRNSFCRSFLRDTSNFFFKNSRTFGEQTYRHRVHHIKTVFVMAITSFSRILVRVQF